MTDSYLDFALSHDLMQVWNIFLLALGRIVPMIAIAPFFGGKSLPDPIKIGFGVFVTAIFLPYLITTTQAPITLDIFFMLLMIKEILIGSLLGFLIAFPFYFTQSSGSVIDHQRGAQSLQVMNPATMSQTSPLGKLYGNVMLVIFYGIGGTLIFFDGAFISFQIVPLDGFVSAEFFSHTRPLYLVIIGMINKLLVITIQLAAPALLSMLLSDLFLGIANRMAPQVQISFLLWSLKAFIGIGMVWLPWWYILKQMDTEAVDWLKIFHNLVENL